MSILSPPRLRSALFALFAEILLHLPKQGHSPQPFSTSIPGADDFDRLYRSTTIVAMEAIGLAVGIAGLAGLFSTCLDLIDKANSYRDYGPESRSVAAQFEADKLLFRRWAQSVGIEEGNSKKNHHSALDNPATALVVLKILSSIQETFNKTKSALLNMQHVSTADPSSKGFIDYTQGLSQNVESKASTSKRYKIG
ncbi:hypothetical protein V492_00204 [Pseudogymnoascus sp. VKM F-4246]|nr:hypothetical protein V492_00204 [Pseudogymnoascus sp. VKM F-4246]